jgi:hypothetical protein
METGLRNQSTKLVGQKIFAARNRAPIIPTALVLRRAHLSMRVIPVEVPTKSIINHESVIGLVKEPAQILLLLNTVDLARPACGSYSDCAHTPCQIIKVVVLLSQNPHYTQTARNRDSECNRLIASTKADSASSYEDCYRYGSGVSICDERSFA